MEYASENEQLKLYNFFNEIISGLPDGMFTDVFSNTVKHHLLVHEITRHQ